MCTFALSLLIMPVGLDGPTEANEGQKGQSDVNLHFISRRPCFATSELRLKSNALSEKILQDSRNCEIASDTLRK